MADSSRSEPTIGVRELRSDLAAHLRRAGRGQRTVVTVGGHAIAQLGPLEAHDGQTTLDDLFANGSLVPPRRTDAPRLAPPVPVWNASRLDRVLAEIRG